MRLIAFARQAEPTTQNKIRKKNLQKKKNATKRRAPGYTLFNRSRSYDESTLSGVGLDGLSFRDASSPTEDSLRHIHFLPIGDQSGCDRLFYPTFYYVTLSRSLLQLFFLCLRLCIVMSPTSSLVAIVSAGSLVWSVGIRYYQPGRPSACLENRPPYERASRSTDRRHGGTRLGCTYINVYLGTQEWCKTGCCRRWISSLAPAVLTFSSLFFTGFGMAGMGITKHRQRPPTLAVYRCYGSLLLELGGYRQDRTGWWDGFIGVSTEGVFATGFNERYHEALGVEFLGHGTDVSLPPVSYDVRSLTRATSATRPSSLRSPVNNGNYSEQT